MSKPTDYENNHEFEMIRIIDNGGRWHSDGSVTRVGPDCDRDDRSSDPNPFPTR